MAAAVESSTREAVRRLAQYRPFDKGGRSLEAMLTDLVLAATAINDGRFDSLSDCQRGFHDLWGLQVELDELRPIIETLETADRVTRRRGGFALTEAAASDLEERAERTAETERIALDEWRQTIETLIPDLSDEEFRELRQDLGDWLNRIIVHHGVEAALLLYPEEVRAADLFERIDSQGLPERRNRLGKIRDEVLRDFVRQATPAQRTLLANRLNTAFYLTVLTLDPQAKALAQMRAEGRRIYLDTNFLYAVLGKAQVAEVESAHRLLALTTELGITVAVTPWTVAELRKSIQTARSNAEKHVRDPRLAQVMLALCGDKGYGEAFWRDYAKSGVRVEDWFAKAEHFEEDLERLNIIEESEGCVTIDARKDEVAEYAALLDRILTVGRHETVLEHDAKHRLLVERLRGEGNIHFSTARYWFLTQDGRLPKYAQLMPDPDDAPPTLPFCISPSAWVQIVRALTPRTEDYEETVVGLLTSPFVGYHATMDQRIVREVVARMDEYDDASPELAIAVLEDTAATHLIAAAEDEEEMAEAIRAAYSDKARELQESARASAEKAAEERKRRERAEERAAEVESDLAAEERRRRAAEADRLRVEEERGKAEEAHALEIAAKDAERKRAVEARESEIEELKAREEGRQTRRRRVARALAGLAILALDGVLLAYVVREVESWWAVTAVWTGAACVAFLAVLVALGKERSKAVASVALAVVGIAGFVLAILAITADS
jgi:hypothetical protein